MLYMKHHNFLENLSPALLVAGCPLHHSVEESHCLLQSSAITGQAKILFLPNSNYIHNSYLTPILSFISLSFFVILYCNNVKFEIP